MLKILYVAPVTATYPLCFPGRYNHLINEI